MPGLWSSAPASIDTPRLKFDDVYCAPPSGRWNPDLGVRFALQGRCTTRRNLGGDGWIPIMGAADDDLREGIDVIGKAMADLGRDPAELQVRGRLTSYAGPTVRSTSRRR